MKIESAAKYLEPITSAELRRDLMHRGSLYFVLEGRGF